jgi:hypothetical protein
MIKKTITAPDTLVTPEQADNKKSETMLKDFREQLDRHEREFNNAKAFQIKPMDVLSKEEVESFVEKIAMKLNANPCESGDVETELKNIKARLSTMSYIREELTEIKSKISDIQAKAKEEPEPRKSLIDKIIQWLEYDLVLYICRGVMLGIVSGAMFVAIHTLYWSDDAWARRAYDAAVQIEEFQNPGNAYHNTRKLFLQERRRTAKGVVLDLENEAREEQREKAAAAAEARKKAAAEAEAEPERKRRRRGNEPQRRNQEGTGIIFTVHGREDRRPARQGRQPLGR